MDEQRPPSDERGSPPSADERGSPPSADERGSPPCADEPLHDDPDQRRWRYLSTWLPDLGFGTAVETIRALLSSPASSESSISSESTPEGADFEPYLPRLSEYCDVVSGPPLSRVEEVQLVKQLDSVLAQVQIAVKELGMQPIELTDIMNSRTVDAEPSYVKSRGFDAGPRIPVVFRSRLLSRAESKTLKKEEDKSPFANTVDEFSASTKAWIAAKVATGTMPSEFAEMLYVRVDCLNQNAQLAVQSASSCFSLPGLRAMLEMPVGITNFFGSIMQCAFILQRVSTMAECVIDNIGTTPGQYTSIGKESTSILTDDFCFKRLKLNAEPSNKMSCALGAQYGGEIIQQYLLKLKGHNKSVLLCGKYAIPLADPEDGDSDPEDGDEDPEDGDAPDEESNLFSTKLAIEKLYGTNLTCVMQLPYPSYNGKIELKGLHPYVAYACDIGLPRNRKIDLSFLLGVKAVGLGALYSYDYEQGEHSYGFGIRGSTSLAAFGFTFKRPHTYRATVCKKIIDSSTTVAAAASYSTVEGDDRGVRVTVGLKHALDPSCYIKARAGSAGISIAVKKSFFDGQCTVKAAANVDVHDPWRCPKIGVAFSYYHS